MLRFAAFDTPIGPCGIAWRGETVVRTALPAATLRDMLQHLPSAEKADPSPKMGEIIRSIRRLLSGQAEDFANIPLDLQAASVFERRVYAETSAIPLGSTRTYGEIAAAIGEPGSARAVGRALGRNPVPIIVPCHRVLAADGRSGGFSAPGGVATKIRLLDIERACRGDQPGLFDAL